ncbi:hypothetical protein JRQ81_020157 [Phrynocephalus forsythii]|uniref:Uncharacterized protein n=1 Tax=Phrynocephalus forsythii TaxID=171643 RepID=A0A9Q1AZ87_9SAUR|nr:hypothetical protein JRQ81_020157 [Phrynocephalus forsythii]
MAFALPVSHEGARKKRPGRARAAKREGDGRGNRDSGGERKQNSVISCSESFLTRRDVSAGALFVLRRDRFLLKQTIRVRGKGLRRVPSELWKLAANGVAGGLLHREPGRPWKSLEKVDRSSLCDQTEPRPPSRRVFYSQGSRALKEQQIEKAKARDRSGNVVRKQAPRRLPLKQDRGALPGCKPANQKAGRNALPRKKGRPRTHVVEEQTSYVPQILRSGNPGAGGHPQGEGVVLSKQSLGHPVFIREVLNLPGARRKKVQRTREIPGRHSGPHTDNINSLNWNQLEPLLVNSLPPPTHGIHLPPSHFLRPSHLPLQSASGLENNRGENPSTASAVLLQSALSQQQMHPAPRRRNPLFSVCGVLCFARLFSALIPSLRCPMNQKGEPRSFSATLPVPSFPACLDPAACCFSSSFPSFPSTHSLPFPLGSRDVEAARGKSPPPRTLRPIRCSESHFQTSRIPVSGRCSWDAEGPLRARRKGASQGVRRESARNYRLPPFAPFLTSPLATLPCRSVSDSVTVKRKKQQKHQYALHMCCSYKDHRPQVT